MYCNMLCVQVCTIRLGALCGVSLLLHNIVLVRMIVVWKGTSVGVGRREGGRERGGEKERERERVSERERERRSE